MHKPCEIKKRLIDAVGTCAEIVTALPDKRREVPSQEYAELLGTLDTLRTLTEQLRRDLTLHREVHGC